MFRFKTLLVSCLILSLCRISPLAAQACSNGNSESTAYIRRDNNRCEGIVRKLPDESNTGPIRIVSFATRRSSQTGNTLTLQIPRIENSQPQVKIQSFEKKYLLDNLSLTSASSFFTFQLPLRIINREKVPIDSLRTLAWFNMGSQYIFVPILFGRGSGEYEFVLYSQYRVSFPQLEIRNSKGQVVHSNPRRNSQSAGQVFMTWDGRNQPTGRYELRLVAKQEENGQLKERKRSILFNHDPSWLR